MTRAVNEKVPPNRHQKGISKEIKIVPTFFCKFSDSKTQLFSFSQDPAGFRKLWEAGRNHFHLSWYLLVSVVTSYGQKPWGELFRSSPVSGRDESSKSPGAS